MGALMMEYLHFKVFFCVCKIIDTALHFQFSDFLNTIRSSRAPSIYHVLPSIWNRIYISYFIFIIFSTFVLYIFLSFHFQTHQNTKRTCVRLKNYNLETGLTASFFCGCNVSSLLFNCVLYSTLFSSTTYGLSSIVFPRIKSEANLISSFASSNKFNI